MLYCTVCNTSKYRQRHLLLAQFSRCKHAIIKVNIHHTSIFGKRLIFMNIYHTSIFQKRLIFYQKWMYDEYFYLLLSARYWGGLRPDSPTYARFPNLLYTAELLCIKQNKNKVLPPYANSPCYKVAHARNSTSSFSISAIYHSCMLGYSCFLSANILIIL